MLLISDSGSTKTTWALMDHKTLKKTIRTAGLNPYFHSSRTIEPILQNDLVTGMVAAMVTEIHFYGAGCSTEKNNRMLKEALELSFHKANIFIHHDILGAARALFGSREGIAGILGTGCNSCYYNGSSIDSRVPSLGYLYGDEGAGSYLGKKFLETYLKNKLPDELKSAFDETYRFTLEDILNSLYNRPFPNRFLAGFSEFIGPRQKHPFLHDMVKASFNAFLEEQISKYDNFKSLPVSFVGSIAFIYQEILHEAAAEWGVHVESVQQSPLEGLIRFHTGPDSYRD